MEYLQHGTTDPHSPVQINFDYVLEQFFFLKPGTRVPLMTLEAKYQDQDTTYTSYLMEDYTVGLSEPIFRSFHMVLFPNPNTGHFTVQFTHPLTVDSFYSVYDAVGRLLFQRPLAKGQVSEEIDLSRFGKGTYLVRVTSREGVCYERLVVQ